MNRCTCDVCHREVPANLDGTPRRHDQITTSRRPFHCSVTVEHGNHCPGGVYNLHPLLFSDPMIRAILEGRKSVTRRISSMYLDWQVGDRVWVRETWLPLVSKVANPEDCHFRASGDTNSLSACDFGTSGYPSWCRDHPGCDGCYPTAHPWRPSIHMPFSAHRIDLELTEPPRLSPLSEVDDEEAKREGAFVMHGPPDFWSLGFDAPAGWTPREAFTNAWSHLHPDDDRVPVRIAFRRLP